MALANLALAFLALAKLALANLALANVALANLALANLALANFAGRLGGRTAGGTRVELAGGTGGAADWSLPIRRRVRTL